MRGIGFFFGVLIFAAVLIFPAPSGLSVEGQRAAAVACLMAAWWITECLPIGATALVPLVLYPFLSVMSAAETARRYADPNVFLFMGGFMIALAMQKWNLHKRIALYVIHLMGAGPRRMLGGFLFATAFLSMWVSNTATAVMILPIGMAVVSAFGLSREKGKDGFASALMLGIAYASSIGGLATLIGSPPNMIFAGQSKMLFPDLPEVGFVKWLLLAFPVSLGFLLIAWGYLSFVVVRDKSPLKIGRDVIQDEIRSLGPWSAGEKGVLTVFVSAALLWITRENIALGDHVVPGWTNLLGLKGIHDGTVAILAAIVLFMVPADRKKGEFLLDWEWAKKLPWEVLLLFGGGFALAESFQVSGLAVWLGQGFQFLQGLPIFWLVLFLCLAVTFLSELMSNTAQVTMMMPILAAASTTLGVHPHLLMIPATMAASLAFMMPVGTPPNAIVFGSGYLTIPQMARTGFTLNILAAFWITAITLLLGPKIFGFGL